MNRNKILVAVDLEEQSVNALQQAYNMAKLFDAQLLLLYVIEETRTLQAFLPKEDYVDTLLKKSKEKLAEIENHVEKTHTDSGVEVDSVILKGKPYEQIIQTAINENVILIVMGRNSVIGNQDRKFIGSNTLNVVRDAPCPVVSIKGDKCFAEFRNILLPIDFTKPVQNQVDQTIKLAGYFGAAIHILSVIPGDAKMTKLLKQMKITQVKNDIIKSGLKCTSEVIESKDKPVSKIILKYAEKKEADLIVLLTQQKRDMVPFFVGSTAQEVIYNSHIPVISIKPKVVFRPGAVTSFVDHIGLMERMPKQI